MSILQIDTINQMSLADAALWYALHGIRVLPLYPGSKIPMLRNWPERASNSLTVVQSWWEANPQANIGLVMGEQYEALDLDQKFCRDGWRSYLEVGGPANPPWLMQWTPSGGLHLIWDTILDLPATNFARKGTYGGIDYRTENGYIVASPSVVDGKPYIMGTGDPSAPIPAKLTDFLFESCKRRENTGEAFPRPQPEALDDWEIELILFAVDPYWRRFLEDGICDDNDISRAAYHCAKHLFKSGWTLERMARIAPETYFAEVGARPSHNASHPMQWVWRYVIVPAHQSVTVERRAMFDVLPDVGGHAGPSEPPAASPASPASPVALPYYSEPVASPAARQTVLEVVDGYAVLEGQCDRLEVGDLRGLEAFARSVLVAGLRPHQVEALLGRAAKATRHTMAVVGQLRRLLEEALEAERQAKGELKPRKSPYVWVETQAKALDTRTGVLLSKDGVLTAEARNYGGSIEAAASDLFLGPSALCPTVSSITYDPAIPPGIVDTVAGVRVYNTFRPSLLAPASGDISPWLDLIRALEFEGGQKDIDALLDRLAYTVQNPGIKINHGILIGGDPGVGKDSLLAPIRRIIGEHNTKCVPGEVLAGNFTDYLSNNRLLIVNEIAFGNRVERHQVAELLKPILAAPPEMLRVDEKNIRPYEIPNRHFVVGFTNHRQAMHASFGERRWLALWANREVEEDPNSETGRAWAAWFAGYYQWLDAGGASAVYAHLLQRDVSQFNPGARPETTGWLQTMIDLSRDPLETYIFGQMRRREGLWGATLVPEKVIIEDIQTRILTEGLGIDGRVSAHRVAGVMAKLRGVKATMKSLPNTGQGSKGGSRRVRCYLLREIPPGADQEARDEAEELLRRTREDLYQSPSHKSFRSKIPVSATPMLIVEPPAKPLPARAPREFDWL